MSTTNLLFQKTNWSVFKNKTSGVENKDFWEIQYFDVEITHRLYSI